MMMLLESQGAKSGFAPLAQSMLLIAGIFFLIYLLAVLAPKIAKLLEKLFPALARTNEPKPIEPMAFGKKEEQPPVNHEADCTAQEETSVKQKEQPDNTEGQSK